MDEIIMNEQVTEVIAAKKPSVNWGKAGVAAIVVGALGAIGYGVYHVVKSKKAGNEQQTEDQEYDNVEVAKHDFLEE